MILPLGDEPNPRGVPLITYGLILINCSIYLFITLPLSTIQPNLNDPTLSEYLRVIMETVPQQLSLPELLQHVSAYDLFVFNYGFRATEQKLYTLFTSMFLHSGFLHLAGNMLFLWIYGDNVEHKLGRSWFLIAYVITGVTATLSQTIFDAGSDLPLVGASGAISGILGFYFIWFPYNRVRLWVVFFPFFMNVIYAPARLVLGIYLVLDNLFPFVITRGLEGGGIAYGAHIGGFFAGLATALLINRQSAGSHTVMYKTRRTSSEILLSQTMANLIESEQFKSAEQEYFSVPVEQTYRLLKPEHALRFGNWLSNNGYSRASIVVYQHHLRDYPDGPTAAHAHLCAGLVHLYTLGESYAGSQHLKNALALEPSPEIAALAHKALATIPDR